MHFIFLIKYTFHYENYVFIMKIVRVVMKK